MSKAVNQHSSTVLLPVQPGKADCLREFLLQHDGEQRKHGGLFSPDKHTNIHLFSASLIPSFGYEDAASGEPGKNEYLLVLEVNYDEKIDQICNELWEHSSEFFIHILDMCDHNSVYKPYDEKYLLKLFKAGIRGKTFYVGVRGISVQEICKKEEIRKKAMQIAQTINGNGFNARELCSHVEQCLRADKVLENTKAVRPHRVRFVPELLSIFVQILVIVAGGIMLRGAGAWGAIDSSKEHGVYYGFPGLLLFMVFISTIYMVWRTKPLQSVAGLISIPQNSESKDKCNGKDSRQTYNLSKKVRMWSRDDAIAGSTSVTESRKSMTGAMALLMLLFVLIPMAVIEWKNIGAEFFLILFQHLVSLVYLVCWVAVAFMALKKIRSWEQIEVYVHRLSLIIIGGVFLLLTVRWNIPGMDQLNGRLFSLMKVAASNVLVLVCLSLVAATITIFVKKKIFSLWTALLLVVVVVYGVVQDSIDNSLVVLSLFIVMLILLYVATNLICALRAQERFDIEASPRWPDENERTTLNLREALISTGANQLISITQVKPHWLRRLALMVVLLYIDIAARWKSTRGKLSGIETIYFAQWYLIDGGQRLLFITNYHGDWDRYLDEFIDSASRGITAIWSNTEGFPRSQWLVNEGCRQEAKFKAFARASQVPTQFYYCAYPDLSVARIHDNIYLTDLLNKSDLPEIPDQLKKQARSDAECNALVSLL